MTRKDYKLIADAISKSNHMYHSGNKTAKLEFIALVSNLAANIKKTNPRFDADKFRDTCFKVIT